MSRRIGRRDFVKTSATAGIAAGIVSTGSQAAEKGVDIWIVSGENKKRMMREAIRILKSKGTFDGSESLTLKVNAAWARTPEQGANTHPDLVDAFLDGCRREGIKRILMPEHPCDAAEYSFKRSGVDAAARKHSVEMIDLKSEDGSFRRVKIPAGKRLKSVEVASEFLDSDILVNMPVAKHHGGATLTCAMKNWMGAVKDRGYWHRNDLHQCIADFSSFIKPDWTIIDATRCMLDRGPKGPTKNMIRPDMLIVSQDQVAADAYASSLFHDSIEKVRYLVNARDMGLGETDIARMNIHRIEV